jgi:hypothetical protein
MPAVARRRERFLLDLSLQVTRQVGPTCDGPLCLLAAQLVLQLRGATTRGAAHLVGWQNSSSKSGQNGAVYLHHSMVAVWQQGLQSSAVIAVRQASTTGKLGFTHRVEQHTW